MSLKVQKVSAVCRRYALVLVFFGLFLCTSSVSLYLSGHKAAATTTGTINFQARLMTGAGSIAPDGNYNVEFKLYSALTSTGTPNQGACTMTPGTTADPACLWVETRTGGNVVHVANGYLTVNLGSVTAFPSTINWSQQLYLTMNIGGIGSPTWDGEMTPRLQLTAVPYAFAANTLVATNGSDTSVLKFGTPPSGGQTITLPNVSSGTTATVCYQTDTACGFVTGTTGSFIQNGTTVQTAANFNIRSAATNSVGGVIQGFSSSQTADLFDVQTWNGTTATTVFGVSNVGDLAVQNVTVAASKSLTVTSGLTSLTGATSGDALNVSNSTSTGNIAVFKDNATAVFTIANEGGVALQNTTNSAGALTLQNAAGHLLFSVDTTPNASNLITNPSFETNTTGWNQRTSCTLTASSSQQYFGNNSGACANTATGAGMNYPVQLSNNTAYSLTFYARSSSAITTNFAFGYAEDGSTENLGGGESSLSQTVSNNGWTRYVLAFTTGPSVNAGAYFFMKQTDGTSRTLYIDAVDLEQSASQLYAPYREGKVQINSVVSSPLQLQNTTDSTTAFQITNAVGGSQVLTVDTLNKRVTIGNVATNASSVTNAKLTVLSTNSNPSISLKVNQSDTSTSGADVADFQLNGTAVFSISNLNGGQAIFQNTANSTGAFQVQNQNGDADLNFDTSNNKLTVGNVTAAAGHGLQGSVVFADGSNSNFGITVQAALNSITGSSKTITLPNETGTVCTSASTSPANCTNFAAATGGTGYIQNQAATAQVANYFIRSAATGSVGAVIQGASGQSVDLFDAQTWNGTTATTVFGVNNVGDLAVQNVTLAANKSLTVTGGATGSRPGSPVEGMIFYDTTTKSLLVYANGKWQADRTTATKIVAVGSVTGCSGTIPVASSNFDAADFVVTNAVGGCTSAQTAINNAISALPSGGGTVYLMEGTYIIDGTINIPDNVTLTGAGSATLIEFKNSTNATVNAIANTNTAGAGNGRITISNLRLDGNKSNQSSGAMVGISLTKVSPATGTPGAKLQNLSIENFNDDGLHFVTAANTMLSNSTIVANTGDGIEIQSSSVNNTIIGNTFQGNGGTGQIYINGAGVVNNTVTGNMVIGGTVAGIAVSSSVTNTITNNTVQGNGTRGIWLTSGSNNTISGNAVSSNSTVGIELSGNTNEISSNKIHDNGASGANDGIKVTGSNNTIANNDITDTAGTGNAINISGSGATANLLSGNRFSGTGATVLADTGTNTIYDGQVNTNGDIVMRGTNGVAIGLTSATSTISVQGSYVGTALPAPAAPTVTNQGTPSTGQYTYAVSATDGFGETLISSTAQTTTGATTLNGTNFNRITWNRVGGAITYKVYRTAVSGGSPATLGLIGTVNSSTATMQLDDTGLAGSGSVPAANTTGGASFAAQVLAGSFQGATAVLTGANALTLGTTGTSTGAVVFKGSTAASGTLTLAGPNNPNTGNFTLSIPAITASANVCTDNSICTGYAAAPVTGAGNFLVQAPTSNTAATAGSNYIQPATTGVNGLTVNGTSTGTAATSLVVNQAGASNGIDVTTSSGTTNAAGITIARSVAGTTTAGLSITDSTAGTIGTGINIAQSGGGAITTGISLAGTMTTGISFGGTNTTDITRTSGVLSLQGTGGVSIIAAGTTSVVADSAGAGSVLLGNTNATTVTLGNTGATTTSIQGGTVINVGTASNSGSIQIGNTSATGTQTIAIGNNGNASGTTNVTIGSASGASGGTTTLQAKAGVTVTAGAASTWSTTAGLLTIQGGSGVTINTPSIAGATSAISIKSGDSSAGTAGNVTIDTGTTSTGTPTVNIANANAKAVQIGNNTSNPAVSIDSGTGVLNIGTGAQARTITLGSTGAAGAVVQQFLIGTNSTAGATNTITIGNTAATASTTTINGGTAAATSTGGAIVLQAGTGGFINIGNTAATKTINIGSTAALAGDSTVSIATSSVNTQVVAIGSNGVAGNTLTLDGGTASTAIQIGNSATAHGIQIGTDGTATQTVKLGSLATSSTTLIQGGTGASALTLSTATTGAINIDTGTTGSILIGGGTASNPAKTISIGPTATNTSATTYNFGVNTAGSQLISVGSAGSGDAAAGTLVNIQGGTTASTAVKIGTNGAGGITLDTGTTGAILIGAGTSSAKTITVGPSATNTNTTTYNFGVNTAGSQLLRIGSAGSGDAAAGTLVNIQGGTTASTAVTIGTNGAGGITLDTGTTGAILIGAGTANNAKTITVGPTATKTSTTTLQLGINTAGTETIQLGSAGSGDAAAGTSVNIQGGTGASAIVLGTNGAGTINIDTGTTGSILIGGGTASNPAKTISIGPTGSTNTSATTYNLGTNTGGSQLISIGSAITNTAAAGTTVLIQGGTSPTAAVQIQALAGGLIGVGTNNSGNVIQVGSGSLNIGTQTIYVGTSVSGNAVGGTTNLILGSGIGATGGTTTLQAKGTIVFATNGTTRATFDSATNAIAFGNGLTASAPNNFTIQGTGSTTTAVAGGSLTIQGGAATAGTANGGSVTLGGGAGFGGGFTGLVVLNTPTFSTAATQSCGSNCNITQANIDGNGAVIINATAASLNVSLTDPGLGAAAAGRVIYVTAANGSNDFTLLVNGGGTGNQIAMRQNTTATMIWNGADWTAAGASSSTTLQAAYDNTLTSAGGAELVVANGANANGLTVRDSSTSPINGTLLEVQSATAAQLFSVSDNVTDYSSDGGAETAGGSSSTFPSNTWSVIGTGPAVSRFTTAGSNIATGAASVSVVTNTTASTGVADVLVVGGTPTALTANQFYNVSFAVRLATGGTFNDLRVDYSKDGTNTSSVACTSGVVVKTSVWTKVNCSFQASASGITSSNAILIRQNAGVAHTFYVDDFSVTLAGDHNYATDGGVDDNTNFATNWSNVTASTATVNMSRNVTDGNDASDSAQAAITVGAANAGLRNKLAINPLTNTLYRISVYAKLVSGTAFTDFKVRYSPTGSTGSSGTYIDCVDYNGQTVVTTGWTQITCYIQTDATTVTTPYIDFVGAASGVRTYIVDTFSMTLSGATSPDVQIGGGVNGGPVTLLTVDRAAAAPIAANNDAYLGSMYYDTTLGKLQCYESDGWGACGSSPDVIITISPEYTNAVLHGTGIGTMTSDLCSDSLSINTSVCGTNETFNFYKWTSPQATGQTYSIYVTYQLPSTFKSFTSGSTSLMGRTDSANSTVAYSVYKNHTGSALALCGSATVSTGVQTSWQVKVATGTADPSTCSFAASDSIVFKIDMTASSNANAYVSNLGFTFTNK